MPMLQKLLHRPPVIMVAASATIVFAMAFGLSPWGEPLAQLVPSLAWDVNCGMTFTAAQATFGAGGIQAKLLCKGMIHINNDDMPAMQALIAKGRYVIVIDNGELWGLPATAALSSPSLSPAQMDINQSQTYSVTVPSSLSLNGGVKNTDGSTTYTITAHIRDQETQEILGRSDASAQLRVYDPNAPLPSHVTLGYVNGGSFNQSTTEQYVKVGAKITYTTKISNSGPGAATNVVVRIPIGPGTFSTAGSSPSCTLNGTAVQCTVSQLAAYASQTFSIVVTYSGCYRDPMQVATVQSDGSAAANGYGPVSWTLVTTNCDSPLSTAAKALTIERSVQVSADTAVMTITLKNGSSQALTINEYNRTSANPPSDYTVKSADPYAACGWQGGRVYGDCKFKLAAGATQQLTLKLKFRTCPKQVTLPPSFASVEGVDGSVATPSTVINCTAAKRWPS